MASIVLKTAADVAAMAPLADGEYTVDAARKSMSTSVSSLSDTAKLTVSAGGTKYVAVPALDGGDTLTAFKANLTMALSGSGDSAYQQITIKSAGDAYGWLIPVGLLVAIALVFKKSRA